MKTANKTDLKQGESAAGRTRVLLYDLESAPYIGYTWGKWEQNVIQFIEERYIISFAYKWLGEKKVHVVSLPDFSGYKKDRKNNKALVQKLHDLLDQADIAVGHNVMDFDDKVANTDFLVHDMKPTLPHKCVDTLKILRSKFALSSNKLDDACARLKIGRKVKHPGFEMWLGCLAGDKKSWALMRKYNAMDVVLLEKLYLRIRAWHTGHPNMLPSSTALFACKTCKSTNLQGRGWTRTKLGEKQRFQCNDCGVWSTSTWVGKKEKKELRLR